jgi:hypothetical protein
MSVVEDADQALQQLRKIMSKLKLTVNEEKTRISRVPEGEFRTDVLRENRPGAPGLPAIEEVH